MPVIDTPPSISMYSVILVVEEQKSEFAELRFRATANAEGIGSFSATGPTCLSARAAALRLLTEQHELQELKQDLDVLAQWKGFKP